MSDLPLVYFGPVDRPRPDWRAIADAPDPDDDLLPATPPGVVAMLGFDPLDEAGAGDLLDCRPCDSEQSEQQKGSPRSREAATRRAAGMIARAEYKARAAERRPMVAVMRGLSMSWRAIAAELGISREEARRLAP